MSVNVPINKKSRLSRKEPQEQCIGYSLSESVAASDQLPSQNPSILVFADDNETRFLFKTALEVWNYKVAEAENIEQAVISTKLKCPQLVLMDTGINIIESLAIMNHLQSYSQFEKTEFILMSGHAQEQVRQTALSAGATIFLTKPIDLELLEKSLQICFKINEVKNTKFFK